MTDEQLPGALWLETGDEVGRIVWAGGAAETLRNQHATRTSQLLALHRMLEASMMLKRATLVEYRCSQHRCLLGRIFDSPIGPALYLPSFRYSPQRNERTDVDARAGSTLDGERRWRESAEILTDFLEPWLQCDHVLDFPLEPGRTIGDAAARKGETIIVG